MDTKDKKPNVTYGTSFSGHLELKAGETRLDASGVIMPDGSTLADTIVSLCNRIDNLEEEVNSLKGKS